MWRAIAVLVIAILIINSVVIGISLIQQTGKVNQADANVTRLESRASNLTGEIAALRRNISGLQASIAESEAKSATLQTEINKVNNYLAGALLPNYLPSQKPPVNPTGPAVFVTSDLKVNENHLQPADIAVVSVTVTNTGAETGSYLVVLNINSVTFATKSVTLSGGRSEIVEFGIEPNRELKARITIDNLAVDALWEVH